MLVPISVFGLSVFSQLGTFLGLLFFFQTSQNPLFLKPVFWKVLKVYFKKHCKNRGFRWVSSFDEKQNHWSLIANECVTDWCMLSRISAFIALKPLFFCRNLVFEKCPSLCPFFVVTNWALMVHICCCTSWKPPQKQNHLKPLFFLVGIWVWGFGVQWNLLGHLCVAQRVVWRVCCFSVVFVFFWCFVLFGCCFSVVVNLLLLLLICGCWVVAVCCCCCWLLFLVVRVIVLVFVFVVPVVLVVVAAAHLALVFCSGCFAFVFECLCFVRLKIPPKCHFPSLPSESLFLICRINRGAAMLRSGGRRWLGGLELPGQVWELRFLLFVLHFPRETTLQKMSGKTPRSPRHPSTLRWEKSRDSYRRIASESCRRDSNH